MCFGVQFTTYDSGSHAVYIHKIYYLVHYVAMRVNRWCVFLKILKQIFVNLETNQRYVISNVRKYLEEKKLLCQQYVSCLPYFTIDKIKWQELSYQGSHPTWKTWNFVIFFSRPGKYLFLGGVLSDKNLEF